jgi:hypothetical protein
MYDEFAILFVVLLQLAPWANDPKKTISTAVRAGENYCVITLFSICGGFGWRKTKTPQENTQHHQPVFGPTSHYSPSRRRGGHITHPPVSTGQQGAHHQQGVYTTLCNEARRSVLPKKTPGRRRPPWFDHFDQNTIPRINDTAHQLKGPPTTRRMGLPAAFGHIQEFERRGRPPPTTRPSARGAHQRERASHLHKHLSTLNIPHAIELLFVYVT